MKCTVTFRHMKPSDAIRGFAEERVAKVAKLIDRSIEAQVVLSVEKHRQVARIELVADGSVLIRGVDRSEDLYASIDAAVERIARQVKRYRAKLKDHRGNAQGRELPYKVLEAGPEDAEESKTPQLVRQETIIARVMSVDEAVMKMDLLDTEFLVFTHAETHQVNVVYRLPDGQFGLIEAHAAA